MYCPNCATPLDPAQSFCPTCGQAAPGLTVGAAAEIPAPLSTPAGVVTRPKRVALAGILLFAAAGLSLVGLVISLSRIGLTRLLSIPTLLLSPILLAAWVMLIVLAMQGTNWARIGIAILVGWSAINVLLGLRILRYPHVPFDVLALPWLSFALRACGGYLLFTRESDDWFRARQRTT